MSNTRAEEAGGIRRALSVSEAERGMETAVSGRYLHRGKQFLIQDLSWSFGRNEKKE